jgi:hypothetical protein
MESTTKDKDGDNFDDSSDQNNNETCTVTKNGKTFKKLVEGI